MRKQVLSFGLIFVLCIAPVFVFGQSSEQDSEQEPTVEEVYLESPEFQMIKQQAFTLNRDTKLQALDNIESMLDEGNLNTGDPQAHYILDYLAMEGTSREVRENGRLVNYYPVIRKRACELLGELGGPIAKDSLIKVLLKDNEPMVLAEAAYALGEIGINPDNDAAKAIAEAMESQNAVAPDNNFAMAGLIAIEKLAEKNEGINSPDVFDAVIHVAQGNYITMVKSKAVDVIDALRSFK